jgi:uncharacterized protein
LRCETQPRDSATETQLRRNQRLATAGRIASASRLEKPFQVECASAIAHLERDVALDDAAATHAFERLRQLAQTWHEIDPSDPIREAAVRFLRVHPLRAADALQLAAAFSAAERRPSSLEVVTLDDRLAVAARKEGFALVVVPASE